jgi:leucyl aminopeptidase
VKLLKEMPCWIESFQIIEREKKKEKKKNKNKDQISEYAGFFYVLGADSEAAYKRIIQDHAMPYQKDAFAKSTKDALHFSGSKGWVWIMRLAVKSSPSHSNFFSDTLYTQARDGAGGLVNIFKALQLKTLKLEFIGTNEEIEVGTLAGFEIGAYHFRSQLEEKNSFEHLPEVEIFKSGEIGETFQKKHLISAQIISESVNWARHWTNLPGNLLNPLTMTKSVQSLFIKSSTVKVEVWDTKRLQKENMNLHLAVGQGAEHGPCMVYLKYRPVKNKKSGKPFVFVGKGITFDTGGLDLKPSSAMRTMKKDMGGAAAVAALCYWADKAQYPYPIDFYIGLAENSVSARAYRPGDIYKAKNGLTVEIHNTDAEGRLVLADVMVAAQQNSEKPRCLIDVATLTGAIKIALGTELTGLFTNNDVLADLIGEASNKAGDLVWRMPLVPKYGSMMNSPVAAMTNAVDGFAGAITAALFLEKFVIPDLAWAHLDIYAWNDKVNGAFSFVGGSGQGVQALIGFLSLCESKDSPI